MLNALLMINSVVLILLVLVQQGTTGSSVSGAFSGNGDLRLFTNSKERGIEKVLSRATLISLITFFVLVAVNTAKAR